jgi:hypothetical protein
MRSSSALFIATIVISVVFSSASTSLAQPKVKKKIYQREPFDRLVLSDKDEDGNQLAYDTTLLDLPGGRRVPDLKTMPANAVLQFREVSDPTRKLEVRWKSVESITLYEDRVLREAMGKLRGGKLDESWDYFVFLKTEFPNTANLKIALQELLFISGSERLKQKRNYEGMSIFEDLYSKNSQFVGNINGNSVTAAQALSASIDRVLSEYHAKKDFYSFRKLLARLTSVYTKGKLAKLDYWVGKIEAEAGQLRDRARAKLQANELRDAHAISRQMLDRWPKVAGGSQLVADVTKAYPLVVVGVFQPSIHHEEMSLNSWPGRRSARLVQRSLVQYLGPGAAGGEYTCGLGTINLSDDRKRINLRFARNNTGTAEAITGYEIGNRIISMAQPNSPNYNPTWAGLMDGLEVKDIYGLEITLRKPFVLPQPLLQFPVRLPGTKDINDSGAYTMVNHEGDDTLYGINRKIQQLGTQRSVEIVERYFRSPEEAILALKRGEIDIIDRIAPSDIPRFDGVDGGDFAIGQYALPTIHVLMPSRKSKFMDNLMYRRGLGYCIDANQILNEAILRGVQLKSSLQKGFRPISGPFLAGIEKESSYSYAYDHNIPPIPYDPILGKVLMELSKQQLTVMAERRRETPPDKLPEVVIGHIAEEHARNACKVITKQLELLKLKVKLVEFPIGQTTDVKSECDLVLTELSMWEPMIDARRLMGDNGLVPANNDYVNLALQELDVANTWSSASSRLQDLHRIANNEMVVIPLYQTLNSYIAHKRIRGIGKSPALLYQDILEWRIVDEVDE